MSDRDAAGILRDATQTLRTAKLGLQDLTGPDASRRVPGLMNMAVFGRSVTLVLQNLRGLVDKNAFDEWYKPHQAEMSEELFIFFRELRNVILNQGTPQPGISANVTNLSIDTGELMRNRPPGATGFFIIDQVGGSGWEVPQPDGSIEKYYVQLPDSFNAQFTTRFHVANSPSTSRGRIPTHDRHDHLHRRPDCQRDPPELRCF